MPYALSSAAAVAVAVAAEQEREAYYGSSNSARGRSATTAYHERAGGRACTVLLRNIERVHFAPAEGGARTGPTTSFYADSVTAKVREAQQTALMAAGG